MNVNFEAIEKAWFKPKKDIIKVNLDLKGVKNLENYITDLEQSRHVLDELEEWIYKNAFIIATSGTKFVTVPDLEDKIQELKKEMK